MVEVGDSVISADNVSEKDCQVFGGSTKENGMDKEHGEGVSGRA